MSSEEHEVVSIYPFNEASREDLLNQARECTFNWSTKDGWPVGVIHAFVWRNGSGWITCGVHRHRVAAIKRDPRCSVVVSGVSAPNGPNGAITFKGRASFMTTRKPKNGFILPLRAGLTLAWKAILPQNKRHKPKHLKSALIRLCGSSSKSFQRNGSCSTATKWPKIRLGS